MEEGEDYVDASSAKIRKTMRKRKLMPSIKNDAQPCLLPGQVEIRTWYMTNSVQIAVAILIFANFLVSMSNAEVKPDKGSRDDQIYFGFEVFFNASFTIELLINMYGSFPLMFWMSGWNWFDFIIVNISLITMFSSGGGVFAVLRLFRAFRVFRLFKRIPSLKLIIEGVGASLPGVANAFVVVQIISGIWSIIGVQFFAKYDPGSFGNFSAAMFSLYQIMTLDAWASAIARPIWEAGANFGLVAVFFVTYTIINAIILTNVVIAILLDKYLAAVGESENANHSEEEGVHVEIESEHRENTITAIMTLLHVEDGHILRSCKTEELQAIMTHVNGYVTPRGSVLFNEGIANNGSGSDRASSTRRVDKPSSQRGAKGPKSKENNS